MTELSKFKALQPRILALLSMLVIFLLALSGMQGKPHPIYFQLPDLGHEFIPNLQDTFGNMANYIWWLGSISEEIYAVILIIVIALTGNGIRWGIAFALMALAHATCWHLTSLPTPPDVLWQFPLPVGQTPRPDDFWFSGHVGSAFLLVLFLQNKLWWLRILSYFYLLFMVWLVLATRTHYSIDVLGGMIIAYIIYVFVNKYIPEPPITD